MAKNNDVKKLRFAHFILVLIIIFVGIISAWVWQKAETKAIAKETMVIKVEGCNPAKKTTFDVALIQKDITIMQTDIADIKTEQKAGFKEILKRLPK